MASTDTNEAPADLPVWIVDDDDVRYSIRFALATQQLHAETFSSGEEFLSTVNPAQPGCLVVDMTMDGMSGKDVQTKLREVGSPIRVILLSGHGTIRMAVEAMENGAVCFLEKPVDPDELIKKVRLALELSRLEYGKARIREKLATFSRREAQIFDLLCQGMKNTDIAEKLFLSQRTVEVHRAHIMKRLDNTAPISILYELARRQPGVSPIEAPCRPRRARKRSTKDETPDSSDSE